MSGRSGKAAVLAELRERIRALEGGGRGPEVPVLPFGVAALDRTLPWGGLPLGCLHELAGTAGAVTGFAAALAGRLCRQRGAAVWISRGRDLYAPGLAACGLGPERLIVVRARRDDDLMWAMEEVLRCPQIGAVLGESDRLDPVAGRRLQLAAEGGGVTGLLLRFDALGESCRPPVAGAVTRWQVTTAPSLCDEDESGVGEPGVGAARWLVELRHCRGGVGGQWSLTWQDGAFAAGGAALPSRPEGTPARNPEAPEPARLMA